MRLYFLDASGVKLLLGDGRAQPTCPDYLAVLQSGGRLNAATELDGTLYSEQGEPVQLQPGEYTVVVDFSWSTLEDPHAAWETREARVMFRWLPVSQWPSNPALQLPGAARNGR